MVQRSTSKKIRRIKPGIENKLNRDMRLIEITMMRGPAEAGGYLYRVNPDGSVGPWSNKPKSIVEALMDGYTIFEVAGVFGKKFREYIPGKEKRKLPVTSDEFREFLLDFYSSGVSIKSFMERYEG